MGCGTSTAAPAVAPVVASQQDGTIEDESILTVIRKMRSVDGQISLNGRSRDVTPKQLESIMAAIDLLDVKEYAGKFSQLSWNAIQESAATTLVMPSTIHQGNTTTCGPITCLEAMACFRPAMYARLVLAVYGRGQVIDASGRPWGATPDLKADLLASAPPPSIRSASVADWMVATAMSAELKDQDLFRDLLGHDDYLGGDAFGPDGRTVDFVRGLTTPWDIKKFLTELVGCTSIDRDLMYWVPRPSTTEKMKALTASGALAAGEVVLLCLISDTLWHLAEKRRDVEKADGWAIPEHWVRVRSVEESLAEYGVLEISLFSMGEVQERRVSHAGWQRICFEAVFGTLNG